MKIVITGGGTGGHFYPLIAVMERVLKHSSTYKAIEPSIYYFGEKEYNKEALANLSIVYKHIPSGKNRIYFSFSNFVDYFRTLFGIVIAFFKLLFIYPDVIFSKGGYDSLPTCVAAFLLRIPIVLHDSDAIPGRATLFISKFAYRVALSYGEASNYFSDKSNLALTGQPILLKYTPDINFTRQYNTERKTILVTGGSLGSVKINDTILEILPELISKYNVIHQTGEANYNDVITRSNVILDSYNKTAYSPYASLDFSRIYEHVDLVIGRAGSSIFEFYAWQIPSIIIPISQAVSRDQVKNAEASQSTGAIKLLYEENLTSHVLHSSINEILSDVELYTKMATNAKSNYKPDAADIIAKEIWNIILNHK